MMSKRITSFLVAATMLVVLSAQAQVTKQTFKRSVGTAQEATVKPGGVKGEVKKLTAQELVAVKQAADKQMLQKQKAEKSKLLKQQATWREPLKHRSFAPRRVEASEATPVTVPYEADFSASGDIIDEDFIIINNNDDLDDGEPCTWKWSAGNGAYYIYNTDGVTAADDYLVLPVTLQGGKIYEVTVNAATWNYPEEFEVVAGTEYTAAALTTTVIDKTTPEDEPADYSGTFTPTADGVYYIAIHCTSAANQYVLSVYRFSIDVAPDPAAPAAVTDFTATQVPLELKTTVTFTAPTTTIGGETLTDNLSVAIVRNGETVKTLTDVAPGSEQTYTDELSAEGTYKYQAVASNAAGQGRKSDIVTVKVAMPQEVPFAISFADESDFDRFTVIDNNEDESTWEYSSYYEDVNYRYNWDNAADDYLVSLPLRMEAGKRYDVTVRLSTEYGTERFEVVAGTTATTDAMNIGVIEATEIDSESAPADYTGTFTAETDGYYYVAIHAISDANQGDLHLYSLSVENGAEVTAPAAPTLTATAAVEGALTATIQVTAPMKTIEGNALTAITKLELYRDGVLIGEQADVTPGAVVTFTDERMESSGLYTYLAMAYNESGKGERSEKATVYVGLDQPVAPETIAATDHANNVDLTWSAVGSVGMNGGYVNPADVTYNVWDIDASDYFVFFNDMITSVKAGTSVSFDYAVDEGEEQGYKYFAVRPVNDATTDEDQADWSAASVFVGKPYDAVAEGFAGESLHYFWETDASLAIANYSSDEDGKALALLASEPGQKVFLSGKLNLKDATNPMLVFDALNASGISTLYVAGSMDRGSWTLLQTVTLSNGDYQTYQIPLTDLKNHERYAQIAFVADYVNVVTDEDYGDYFFLDNIRIGDILDNDLSISAFAPSATLVAGTSQTIDVVVENIGLLPASNYTVKLIAGEKELINETVANELAPFAKKVFQAEMTTTVFDEAGDVMVTVSVAYAADQNTENNSISAAITIEEPTAAKPENLVATQNDSDVELTWSAPEAKTEAVTENFESGAGEFTQINGNDDGYGWTYIYDDANEELMCHSGYGGMQSYSYVPNVGAVHVDNWLITPLAILDGAFSFWAAAQDGDWTDEHFAVYVSTTGNESVDDFTQVSEEFVATGWTQEYTIDLSSYAGKEGYIAIRHFNSYDNFALVVDDIAFTKAPALPVKYNVYADQQLAATVEGEATTYAAAVDQLTDGEHTFAVTAVYASGKESRPATATINVTNSIRQLTTDGLPRDFYTVGGQRLAGKPTAHGIYIYGDKKVVVK